MSGKKERRKNGLPAKICGLLLGLCLIAGMNAGVVYADEGEEIRSLLNGSFEDGQSWEGNYQQPNQDNVPYWNTTATDKRIELFRENTNFYINNNVTLKPPKGKYAAELNAEEESTLYQNVKTTPSSVYKWGLDHGARNGTDTMALVIGPKQSVDPAKPSKNGRDQFMQMIDWLIEQGLTSVKDSEGAGLGEQLTVYSKKFAEGVCGQRGRQCLQPDAQQHLHRGVAHLDYGQQPGHQRHQPLELLWLQRGLRQRRRAGSEQVLPLHRTGGADGHHLRLCVRGR